MTTQAENGTRKKTGNRQKFPLKRIYNALDFIFLKKSFGKGSWITSDNVYYQKRYKGTRISRKCKKRARKEGKNERFFSSRPARSKMKHFHPPQPPPQNGIQ